MRVQEKIDRLAAEDRLARAGVRATSSAGCTPRFYRDAPEATLSIKSAHAEFRMAPGEWRSAPEHDVAVGRHVPPSSHSVEPFMAYFEWRYRFEGDGSGGAHPGHGGRASPVELHSSLPGRQWPGEPSHEPRHGAEGRHRAPMACGRCRAVSPGASTARRGIQDLDGPCRYAASGRPGWARQPLAQRACRLHALVSEGLPRPGDLHGGTSSTSTIWTPA